MWRIWKWTHMASQKFQLWKKQKVSHQERNCGNISQNKWQHWFFLLLFLRCWIKGFFFFFFFFFCCTKIFWVLTPPSRLAIVFLSIAHNFGCVIVVIDEVNNSFFLTAIYTTKTETWEKSECTAVKGSVKKKVTEEERNRPYKVLSKNTWTNK